MSSNDTTTMMTPTLTDNNNRRLSRLAMSSSPSLLLSSESTCHPISSPTPSYLFSASTSCLVSSANMCSASASPASPSHSHQIYRTISPAPTPLGLTAALSSNDTQTTTRCSQRSSDRDNINIAETSCSSALGVDVSDNVNHTYSCNLVLQSAVSLPLPSALCTTEKPSQQDEHQVIRARVNSSTASLVSLSLSSQGLRHISPGLSSLQQQQFFQHLAQQQQEEQPLQHHQGDSSQSQGTTLSISTFKSSLQTDEEFSPSSLSSSSSSSSSSSHYYSSSDEEPSSPVFNPYNSKAFYLFHQNNQINSESMVNLTASSMHIASPSESCSDFSSAFHSPSASTIWTSPSCNMRGPSISLSQQIASISEEHIGSQSQNKGKGIARAYHRYNQRRIDKASFDVLPREIRIHIFRYLSTFQLIRVSRVSRAWRGIAMDGSLWKTIDVTRYYKSIKDNQLRALGSAASNFLRCANFRGCVQLSDKSLTTIAERCPNIERLNLTGCRLITSKAIADACTNLPLLVHLDLAGLQSVNNFTLQTLAVYCRSLQILNLAWCKQISGSGLIKLTRSCQELQKLNVSGCPGLEDRYMPVIGMNMPKMKELCLNGCTSLTDRGLIGLLSGLSVTSSKKHRKWRMRKRMASSVRVSSLGHLLINQSSCNDDDSEDEEGDDIEKEGDSDKESDIDGNEDENDEGDSGEDATEVGSNNANAIPIQPLSSSSKNNSSQAGPEGLQARLVYLGLSQCRLLTQEALRAIGHLCSRHLRRLEISSCENFNDEGLIYLAQRCTHLRSLDLEDVTLLTDASLRAFALNLPRLERICLSYCENVTDQGVMHLLRPASNPTTLSTATAMMMNIESPSPYCPKLTHIELDNCLLITDRLLLEFANVLEERAVAALERRKEREKKREERGARIQQRKRKPMSPRQTQQEKDMDEVNQQTKTGLEPDQNTLQLAGPSSTVAADQASSSSPVNIPSHFQQSSAFAAGSPSSYSSSPLQPRSVLASTSLSDEIVVKKTRPGTRIMAPTRSFSDLSTSSTASLPLTWPAEGLTLRNANGNNNKKGGVARARRPIRPTMQVFDCRNITLEGVEAAKTRSPSLLIRSYYSWTHPSASGPAESSAFAGNSSSGSGGMSFFDGEGEGNADDEDADGGASNGDSSNTSLHHLQHMQQQIQSRRSSMLQRARSGLSRPVSAREPAQCCVM
ncbi:hypothetical protein BCR41DRAFT_357918 [Lobosporangium transversale]|uniref:F-box domain-containing protein n=1 Tax=Lobosporangium transversale TaxID=64571 RepID=A0A1Y2GIA6_9FUNG|nr:hypothetical protein BCR41DRAFT_357918 [Lobosporangium transversale]ORZ10384.1 hypothetical protein BCR41DRAFT_357918 [Lobosporangium transversale]|eukprot:XP_021879291.1 hypothetical protein BCR41DRAFT_357918 [Lobosporangium transversale]